MNKTSWLPTITVAGVLALPIVALGDYVADDSEIAAMKAKILKIPPTAETLTAPPYPGSQLDAECSADQSATHKAEPMVYCLYTRDSLDKVKAYLAGPGKPAAWVSVFADEDNVTVNGRVTVADVTQVRYFVSAKREAAAHAAAATPPPAPAAGAAHPPAAATAETAPAANVTRPAAPAEKSDATPTAEKAVEAVNKLKGLFGR